MTKYLFTTLPSNDLGLLTRSLPIARELRDRGHHVTFCSPAKAPNKLISQAGFENLLPSQPLYFLISGDVNFGRLGRLLLSRHPIRDVGLLMWFLKNMSNSSTAEIWDIDHFLYLFGMSNEDLVRVNVGAMAEVMSACQPDVVVDFCNPFACIAARASHTPLMTVIQADMHPQSQGFIWWKEPPSELHPSPVPATNRALAEYDLPPIGEMGDLLVGDVTLVLGLPDTDPLPDTADVAYVGPILWQEQEEQLPDWVNDLGKEQPVVWLYPGNLQYVRGSSTFGDSAVVLEACIEALGNEALQVVLTTGHHSLPSRFVPLPPNFRHEPFVPGLAMAERSDLLIHHGGYGSCQTGLYTGTPALIIPTYSERESNARRIAAQGAGDYVVPESDHSGRNKRLSAHEVRTKVFNIFSDTSFTENAKRISERMKAYGGASEAARLIEGFQGRRVSR
jgi:UDP:flavonoid glycosyltransferase YjiC (YdhE family)